RRHPRGRRRGSGDRLRGRAHQRARAALVSPRPRLPRPCRTRLTAQGRGERRVVRLARVHRRAAPRHRRAVAPLPMDGTMRVPSGTQPQLDGLDPAFAPNATVDVHDASVWFAQKVALSELSCSFGAGVTGLLGPNGAGKTTLMRAITGLMPVNQG